MTAFDADDQGLRDLSQLHPLTPDPMRADGVRARCHAELWRRRHPDERSAPIATIVAPLIVGGLCAGYAAALVSTLIRLHGAIE